MPRIARLVFMPLFLLGLVLLVGCDRGSAPGGTAEALVVPVAKPIQAKVRDYVFYTGRTNAKEAVTIVPRVTGYLEKMPFKEGAEVKGPVLDANGKVVKQGTLLFVIDDRPYKAQLDAAKAAMNQNIASLKYAVATNKRFKDLEASQKGAVSEQQLEQYQAQEDIAKANIKLAEANLESAQLNMEWTRVYSPIDGIISRYYLTGGNLVNQDVTQLTTLVRMDPMYANFDVDEPTLLRIKQAINDGKIADPQGGSLPVEMGLSGEDGFPHAGKVNFFDNQVNAGTGSISVRGEFENHKPKGGTYLLLPGMFVRIRLPLGDEQEELLVKDSAITSEQGRKYVYVVDKDSKVERRDITVGALQDDGLRVIRSAVFAPDGKVLSGITKDDWVLVGALQQVRPPMTVKMDPLERMPSVKTPARPVEKKDKAKGKK